MTSGAIHVAQVPESGWPCPLPPPLGCNLSTNRKRKPKWRRCVAASIAVGPSAILTGSRTRPSDWGSNARFGPVEDRRNNRRLATFTCTPCVLQIWWPSPLSIPIPESRPIGFSYESLSLAGKTTGFPRFADVPRWEGCSSPPVVRHLRRGIDEPPSLTTCRFGPSVIASSACSNSRRLSLLHLD